MAVGRLFWCGNEISLQWKGWFSSCSTSPLWLMRERVPGWQSHSSTLAGEWLLSLDFGWLHGSPCTIPGTTARHLCYVNTPSALMYSAWNKLQRCTAAALQKKVGAAPRGEAFPGFPLPGFPFSVPHRSLCLKCSCPFSSQIFNLISPVWDRDYGIPPSPVVFTMAGSLAERQRALARFLCPEALQKEACYCCCPLTWSFPGARRSWCLGQLCLQHRTNI